MSLNLTLQTSQNKNIYTARNKSSSYSSINFKELYNNKALTSKHFRENDYFDNKSLKSPDLKSPENSGRYTSIGSRNTNRREKLKTLLLEKLAQKFNAFEYLEIIEKNVSDILNKEKLSPTDVLDLEHRIKDIINNKEETVKEEPK